MRVSLSTEITIRVYPMITDGFGGGRVGAIYSLVRESCRVGLVLYLVTEGLSLLEFSERADQSLSTGRLSKPSS